MLFPLPIGAARVAMSAVAVFAGTALVTRIFAAGAAAAHVPVVQAASCAAAGSSVVRFVKSCFYVAGRTIPLLVVGVVVGMAISDYLPVVTFTSWQARAAVTAIIALLAIPIALPTFFEVPLALALLSPVLRLALRLRCSSRVRP